jgi:hypothetical protein
MLVGRLLEVLKTITIAINGNKIETLESIDAETEFTS